MTSGDHDRARPARPGLIDLCVPNAARTAEFLTGGTGHFAADRAAARAITAAAPVTARIPAEVRAFRHRALRFLAGEAGIRQFLDIGQGLVPAGGTHEVAWPVGPVCRVVYADSDPLVLGQAQALAGAAPTGAVSCVRGELANPEGIIEFAAAFLDLGLPAAVLLLSSLAHVPTAAAAARAVSALMAAVPSGSHLVICHLASDLDPALPAATRQWNKTAATRVTLRSGAELLALTAGLDLVPPGMVPVTSWRPDGDAPAAPVPVRGLIARKP